MRVHLAKSAGFCFGVRKALTQALATAKTSAPIFMLGDIVHNEEVIRQIQGAGIKKITRLTGGAGKTLLIRTHGCSNKVMQKALKFGYQIVDVTCPMVKEIHKIARKLENAGCQIIVIGDKLHDEVSGIIGQLKKKALVIDKLKNIPLAKIKNIKRAGIVVQSTQNLENVEAILKVLRKYIPQIKFHNTICNPTRIKQNEIKTMPLKNEVMIIIGSKSSANTKRMYEISRSLNKHSYWVNSADEVRKSWVRNTANIGITAGASTPKSSIDEVIKRIKTI